MTEAIIGPLHPYYTYNCTILAVTVGEGPPSTVITVRTEEDGEFKAFPNIVKLKTVYVIVPLGPPTNFTVSLLSSTAVQLSWRPPLPEESNGIIRQYIIYAETLFGDMFSTTTTSRNFTVSSLKPFTTYSFSVAAITIGAGPATEKIQVQTVSDGILNMYTYSDIQ